MRNIVNNIEFMGKLSIINNEISLINSRVF